jgi:hypothetical protein
LEVNALSIIDTLKEKKIILVIVIILILGGGGFAYMTMFMGYEDMETTYIGGEDGDFDDDFFEDDVPSVERRIKVTPPSHLVASTPKVKVEEEPKVEIATAEPTVEPTVTPKTVVKPTPKATPKPTPVVKKATSKPVKKTVASGSFKPYVINLASFSNSTEAKRLRDVLIDRGETAYTMPATVNGVQWYRVRVGFFASSSEAKRAAKPLEKRLEINGAWVSKVSKSEYTRHSR